MPNPGVTETTEISQQLVTVYGVWLESRQLSLITHCVKAEERGMERQQFSVKVVYALAKAGLKRLGMWCCRSGPLATHALHE